MRDDQIQAKFTALDEEMSAMTARVIGNISSLNFHEKKMSEINGRIDNLQGRIDRFYEMMMQKDSDTNGRIDDLDTLVMTTVTPVLWCEFKGCDKQRTHDWFCDLHQSLVIPDDIGGEYDAVGTYVDSVTDAEVMVQDSNTHCRYCSQKVALWRRTGNAAGRWLNVYSGDAQCLHNSTGTHSGAGWS